MPCYDPTPNDYLDDQIKKVNKLTRMLCGLLTHLDMNAEFSGDIKKITDEVPDLTKWWKDHKAADKRRLKREREEKRQEGLRQSALAKLSQNEIHALGLHQYKGKKRRKRVRKQ